MKRVIETRHWALARFVPYRIRSIFAINRSSVSWYALFNLLSASYLAPSNPVKRELNDFP